MVPERRNGFAAEGWFGCYAFFVSSVCRVLVRAAEGLWIACILAVATKAAPASTHKAKLISKQISGILRLW